MKIVSTKSLNFRDNNGMSLTEFKIRPAKILKNPYPNSTCLTVNLFYNLKNIKNMFLNNFI